ncbi:MAG TPA: nucleoside deaminase, partial [Alphaproteobacteria bacterium]
NVANGGRPFGAVVVRAGEIVSRGVNTVMQTHDPTGHAEMNAIRDAVRALGRGDLSDCEIYASGEPCPMCYGAIHWARIPVVYYGCSGEDAAGIGFATTMLAAELCRPLPQRSAPRMVQYGRDEALTAFRAWQARHGAKRA